MNPAHQQNLENLLGDGTREELEKKFDPQFVYPSQQLLEAANKALPVDDGITAKRLQELATMDRNRPGEGWYDNVDKAVIKASRGTGITQQARGKVDEYVDDAVRKRYNFDDKNVLEMFAHFCVAAHNHGRKGEQANGTQHTYNTQMTRVDGGGVDTSKEMKLKQLSGSQNYRPQ